MNTLGIDIVFIPRLKNQLHLIDRILSPEEKIIFKDRHESLDFLAGRFAAKEAIFKLLPSQKLSMSDIVILSDAHGKPFVKLEGYNIEVSISHDGEYAVAIARLIKD